MGRTLDKRVRHYGWHPEGRLEFLLLSMNAESSGLPTRDEMKSLRIADGCGRIGLLRTDMGGLGTGSAETCGVKTRISGYDACRRSNARPTWCTG